MVEIGSGSPHAVQGAYVFRQVHLSSPRQILGKRRDVARSRVSFNGRAHRGRAGPAPALA